MRREGAVMWLYDRLESSTTQQLPLPPPGRCLSMEPSCFSFTLIWTPGSGRVSFPPVAGLPIGPGAIEYGVLQVK